MHRRGLLCIAFVGTSLKTWRHAFLHLRVDAAGKCRVGMKVFVAAAQFEKVEHAFEEGFRGRARGEGAEKIVRCGFCNSVGYRYAGVSIVHRHAQKGRRLEVQPLARSLAESRCRCLIKQQPRLEVRSSQSVFNASNALGETEALRLPGMLVGSGGQQSPQSVAQIGRSTYVGFGALIRGKKREDPGASGDVRPRRVLRIKVYR